MCHVFDVCAQCIARAIHPRPCDEMGIPRLSPFVIASVVLEAHQKTCQ